MYTLEVQYSHAFEFYHNTCTDYTAEKQLKYKPVALTSK